MSGASATSSLPRPVIGATDTEDVVRVHVPSSMTKKLVRRDDLSSKVDRLNGLTESTTARLRPLHSSATLDGIPTDPRHDRTTSRVGPPAGHRRDVVAGLEGRGVSRSPEHRHGRHP